jgi:hypothetical protein
MNYLLRIGAVYAVVVLVLGAALFALLPPLCRRLRLPV